MLDFLGDVGGFFEAIFILSLVGVFFSQKFFLKEIGNKLYLRKLTRKEIDLYREPNIKKHFEYIT